MYCAGPQHAYSPRGYEARTISLSNTTKPQHGMSASTSYSDSGSEESLNEIPVTYTQHGNPHHPQKHVYKALSPHDLIKKQYQEQYNLSLPLGSSSFNPTPRKSYEDMYLASARTDDDVMSSYTSTGPLCDHPLEYGYHIQGYIRQRPARHNAVPPLDLSAVQADSSLSTSQRLKLKQNLPSHI